MTDLTPFEQRLAERIGRELDRGDLPFDPDRIASAAAMVRRGLVDRALNRLAIGPLPMGFGGRRAVLVALATLVALVTFALAVGVVSRDGARLAVIRWNGDVVVARGDGSEEAVVHRVAENPRFVNLAWAPGGEHLAIVDETLQFSIINRTGDVVYTRTVEPSRGRFAWSPDGKRIAIFDGPWPPEERQDVSGVMILPRLEIIGLDGAIETMPLPPDFWFDIGRGYVAWSRDGRSIVVTGTVDRRPLEYSPSSLWIVDTVDRTARELPSGDPSRAVSFDVLPAWLSDGRLVYSSFNVGVRLIDPRTDESTTLHEIDMGGCRAPCGAPYVSALEVSPDGTRLAFFDPVKRYSILDLATGTAAKVPFPQSGGFPHPLFGYESTAQWTGDGRGLIGVLYTGTTPETRTVSVARIDIATGALQELVADARTFDYVP